LGQKGGSPPVVGKTSVRKPKKGIVIKTTTAIDDYVIETGQNEATSYKRT